MAAYRVALQLQYFLGWGKTDKNSGRAREFGNPVCLESSGISSNKTAECCPGSVFSGSFINKKPRMLSTMERK